jgi:hypothetical protein
MWPYFFFGGAPSVPLPSGLWSVTVAEPYPFAVNPYRTTLVG